MTYTEAIGTLRQHGFDMLAGVLEATLHRSDSEARATLASEVARLGSLLAPEDAGMVEIPPGGAVLLDELGALPIELRPSGDFAVRLELGGRLNKTDKRWKGSFVMGGGHAGEIIAALVVAARAGTPELRSEIDVAIRREQARLVAEEPAGG